MNLTIENIEKTETSLVIRRIFSGRPARLFAAWTEPAQLNQWLHPNAQLRNITAVDLRVYGQYRIEMHPLEGDPYVVVGQYQEIVPDEKLVFTWRWLSEEEIAETWVTVAFSPTGSEETELVLTHERFISPEERDSHAIGWEATLGQLENYLS